MLAAGPWEEVDRAVSPGGAELVLYRRGASYQIRADGWELMSSTAHGSEEALARLGCSRVQEGTAPRVLVGGLGLGYTLRAALDLLPPRASVLVAELFPAVVAWNLGPAGELAGRPLADPRVEVVVGDVREALAGRCGELDAVLLDVDNGPSALSHPNNAWLYRPAGLSAARRALRPGGCLAVWSAWEDAGFADSLARAGFQAETYLSEVAETGGRVVHAVYLGVSCAAAEPLPGARSFGFFPELRE